MLPFLGGGDFWIAWVIKWSTLLAIITKEDRVELLIISYTAFYVMLLAA